LPRTDAVTCTNAIRRQISLLQEVGIFGPGEQQRVQRLNLGELARSDQTRLRGTGRHVDYTVIGLAGRPPEQPLIERSLQVADSRRLRAGALSLQVIVDEREERVAAMNVQIRGGDELRGGRAVFQRYDLDFAQMGDGPVSHFNAHWHMGEDPDASPAEDDPRLPALILDPTEVIDVLIETWLPQGPKDLR
jgi:hypothetical protein